ncbi:hypothetical protein J2S40_001875 [Nocardioides luteus]|uniref:Secreted protein n=1 Tax=Nocardioides luteus TaxID=1844 RepID=A0ABQ5SYZ3_9ACTN|nr:hypothetical protein [Nocardioides luteus]MDR7310817.1 hypothetical protein [Nocardioides luteus]GGR40456.1 hypothetical protein GCM10010197_01790 [Nocardioides luteus]GLJ69403.1 hypothetical protein GCM10017579_34390 [Nocardioides luteus]
MAALLLVVVGAALLLAVLAVVVLVVVLARSGRARPEQGFDLHHHPRVPANAEQPSSQHDTGDTGPDF